MFAREQLSAPRTGFARPFSHLMLQVLSHGDALWLARKPQASPWTGWTPVVKGRGRGHGEHPETLGSRQVPGNSRAVSGEGPSQAPPSMGTRYCCPAGSAVMAVPSDVDAGCSLSRLKWS